MPFRILIACAVCYLVFTSTANAQNRQAFTDGPIIKGFGKVADVDSDVEIPEGFEFKIRFDVGRKASVGAINSSFDSVARLINLHARAGVPIENMDIAIVVHGSAALDLGNKQFYSARNAGKENGSATAIATLQKHNVTFYLCGQSAAYQEVTKNDLLDGVKLGWSAMTIHAILDKQGYSLNPF